METKRTNIRRLRAIAACVTLASTFAAWGQAGRSDTSYQPNPSYVVSAVAIDAQGRALIAGDFHSVDGWERRAIARLNTSGTVDTSFVPAVIEGSVDALILQPDGKVLIGGQFGKVNAMPASFVARLHANGAVDPTFNSSLTSSTRFLALALQADQKVLVASDHAVVRLMPDGLLMVSGNLVDWKFLGTATEPAPGQFEFSDRVPSYPTSLFYRLCWP